jgi:hypothetical protein
MKYLISLIINNITGGKAMKCVLSKIIFVTAVIILVVGASACQKDNKPNRSMDLPDKTVVVKTVQKSTAALKSTEKSTISQEESTSGNNTDEYRQQEDDDIIKPGAIEEKIDLGLKKYGYAENRARTSMCISSQFALI